MKKRKTKELTIEQSPLPLYNSSATEIVDKTGVVGIDYGRIPVGRAFRVLNTLHIFVMTPTNADNKRACYNIQTGGVIGYTKDTRCQPLKLKIYVTRTLSE